MSIDSHSTKQHERPSYPQPTRAEKAAMALVAVLVSGMLLGSMLSMFEMRSEERAMARGSVKTQPATDGLAVRKINSGRAPEPTTKGRNATRRGQRLAPAMQLAWGCPLIALNYGSLHLGSLRLRRLEANVTATASGAGMKHEHPFFALLVATPLSFAASPPEGRVASRRLN